MQTHTALNVAYFNSANNKTKPFAIVLPNGLISDIKKIRELFLSKKYSNLTNNLKFEIDNSDIWLKGENRVDDPFGFIPLSNKSKNSVWQELDYHFYANVDKKGFFISAVSPYGGTKYDTEFIKVINKKQKSLFDEI